QRCRRNSFQHVARRTQRPQQPGSASLDRGCRQARSRPAENRAMLPCCRYGAVAASRLERSCVNAGSDQVKPRAVSIDRKRVASVTSTKGISRSADPSRTGYALTQPGKTLGPCQVLGLAKEPQNLDQLAARGNVERVALDLHGLASPGRNPRPVLTNPYSQTGGEIDAERRRLPGQPDVGAD